MTTPTARYWRSGTGGTLPRRAALPSPSVDMSQEIKLFSNSREREKYDNLADLFAIIVCMEHLEKAYVRDAITADEYTPACSKLIAQFKTAHNLNRDHVPSVPEFMNQYHLSCPAAASRLLIGVPATVEHQQKHHTSQRGNEKHVAETVQHLITLMDSIKLNMTAVDQIHPLLSDLMEALSKVSSLPADFPSKQTIKEWLVTLNTRKASDILEEDEVRQLLFDLERAHDAFYRALSAS